MPSIPSYSLIPALALCLVAIGCERAGDAAPAEEVPQQQEMIGGVPIDSIYGASYAENLRVRQAEVEIHGLPDDWDGVEIAVLSELNLGASDENEAAAREAIARIARSEVRVVALLGNYLASPEDAPRLTALLRPLEGRRVFAVLGAGDRATEEMEETVRATLEAAGVRLLHNFGALLALEEDGEAMSFIGLEPEFRTRPDWRRAEINAAVAGHPSRSIVLSADPRMLPNLPEDRHALVLAGGTVCGDGVIPGRARLPDLTEGMLAGRELEATRRGFRVEGNSALIACGIGHGFLPLRLAGPPEMLVVELVSVGRAARVETEALEEGEAGEEGVEAEVPAEPDE
jgi:uncharacterized protein